MDWWNFLRDLPSLVLFQFFVPFSAGCGEAKGVFQVAWSSPDDSNKFFFWQAWLLCPQVITEWSTQVDPQGWSGTSLPCGTVLRERIHMAPIAKGGSDS